MLLTGLLVVSLALLLTDIVWIRWSARREAMQGCAEVATAAERRSRDVTGQGIRLTVLGDSYAQGYGLVEEEDAWPRYLAEPLSARVVVDSFSGSGFTPSATACDGVSFAERADDVLTTRPRIVVIQGGLNDVRSSDSELRTGVREALAEFSDVRVVVVGPASPPSWSGMMSVDVALREECRRAGIQYISALHWALDYQPDGHLTLSGHRVFGKRIADAIRKGLPRPLTHRDSGGTAAN